jgi:hypothetical protein
MADFINISDESVHTRYQNDPLPNIEATYKAKLYTKVTPDEKEVAEVFIEKSKNEKRIGWIIPLLAITSIEHDFASNQYFIKHAFEAFKLLKGQDIPEESYILIVSENLLTRNAVDGLGYLSLSFSKFGIYPYYNIPATYSNTLSADFENRIVIKHCFDFDRAKDYFQLLTHSLIQSEDNNYARFMFLYQIFELAMECIFYYKINEFKGGKHSLKIVRDKVKELSSERKLINLLYQEADLCRYDYSLSEKAKLIFGTYKDDKYYSDTFNSDLIYDIRNSLVHSYHRFDLKSELTYFCDYLELEVFEIINFLHSNESIRNSLYAEHFEKIY